MMDDRRQTIDTADRAYIPPARAQHQSSPDDASETQYSTASSNTLAQFLIAERPRDMMSPEKFSRLRQQKEEASAAINALNQFIFVAGHTFKGRQLNPTDKKRLREAAEQVGLSFEVVDTLVEQTSDQNAVLKYCMASDDAFARKMKNDPQLSRLLGEGANDDGSGFDVAASVWRVFMHKIIQQFLKDHDMKLSDVMSKESLTSRLYQEALRNEKKSVNQTETARIHRDYTMERQRLFISEEEAQLARQQAEARMNVPTHRSFLGLMPSDGEDYIMSGGQPVEADDVLSLRPGVYPPDDTSTVAPGTEAFEGSRPSLRGSGVQRCHSAPLDAARRRRPAASDGEEEVSAVKRGLAVFGKSPSREEMKRQRRSSLDALEQLKLMKSRANFESGNSENMGGAPQGARRPQRQSLTALQESNILNSKSVFETNDLHGHNSEHAGTFQRPTSKPLGTPKVNKLNPDLAKVFENDDSTDRIKGHFDDRIQGHAVTGASVGSFVKSTKQNYELSHHNGEISEGESKPVRPMRATGTRRNAVDTMGNSNGQTFLDSPGLGARSHQYEAVVTVGEDICNDTMQNSGRGHALYAREKPEMVIVNKTSDDSNGVLSSITQSSSSSQEEGQSHSRRRSSRSKPIRQSRASTSDYGAYQGSPGSFSHSKRGNDTETINSMERPVSSRQREQRKHGCDMHVHSHHQSSDIRTNGPQHGSRGVSAAPYHSKNAEFHSKRSPLPSKEQTDSHSDGWVDFGSNFQGPQTRHNNDNDSDSDAARQPNNNHFSPVTIQPLTNTYSQSQNLLTDEKRHRVSGRQVEAVRRKAQTLLSDEDQPVIPGKSRRKQNQPSKSTPNRDKHRSPGSNPSHKKTNGIRSGQSDQWTNFQSNPFSTHETKEEMRNVMSESSQSSAIDESVKDGWEFDGPNPASTSISDEASTNERVTGHFRNVRSNLSNKKSKQPSSITNTSKQRIFAQDMNKSFQASSNEIVWSADVDTSVPNAYQMHEAFSTKDTTTRGSRGEGVSRQHANNINQAFRRVNEIENRSFDGGSAGLYGRTETTRSMSSESDFDAINTYEDSDMRRLENIQASEHTRIRESGSALLHRDQGSYPHSPRQPDAPLVTQRGSRASDVMGVVSKSRGSTHVMADSLTGISSSHTGLDSYPLSTMTSNLDSTVRDEVYIDNLEEEQQAMVNCQMQTKGDCEMDPNKAFTVGGVRLMEASYQPMNGGPPTLTPGGANSSHQGHNEWHENRSHKLRQRMPTPHYGNPDLPDDDQETLNSYMDAYSYESKGRRSSVPPHTPSFQSDPTPKARPFSSPIPTQRQEDMGSMKMKNSSDKRSDVLMENAARSSSSEEEEVRDVANYRSHRSTNHGSRDRYLEAEPAFDELSQGPTSPTQLRSSDSESTYDEEDIRLAAQRRGISPDVVNAILNQTNSKIRRAPLKGVEVPTPTNDPHEAPIDSDTCRPASVRHLRKDVGPECDPIYDVQGASWGEISENQGPSHQSQNSRAPPPPPDPPREAQAILEALQDSAEMTSENPLIPGMPELPDGASLEQMNLLNRFIEVASSNFDGMKLSADSEKRVRAAAEKVGLSQKFVDQLLAQANANNNSATSTTTTTTAAVPPMGDDNHHAPIPTVGVPEDYTEYQDESTYYTHDNTTHTTKPPARRKKRRTEDVGCNAWEQLDYWKKLVLGSWATTCGTPGDVHHEDTDDDADAEEDHDDDDDGSSISSDGYRDELTRKLRKAQKKKRGRNRKPAPAAPPTPQRGFV